MGFRASHWGDRLTEGCGAVALAGGGGASAWLLAPVIGLTPAALAIIATCAGGLSGWALVRAVPSSGAGCPLPNFAIAPVAHSVRTAVDADELLLGEQVVEPGRSRVVQLFTPGVPGELQARIAAHLFDQDRSAPPADGPTPWPGPPVVADASEALHAALDDLRRSLRAG